MMMSYLKYGALWYVTWILICFVLYLIKFFLIGDFLVLAILGMFSIILSLIGVFIYESIKEYKNKHRKDI
jgi:hypothetical protein